MKILGFVLALACLSGCQSIESRIDQLPSIDFDPEKVGNTASNVDGKVSFQVASAGTEAWMIVRNGTRNFIEFSGLSLAGSRCSYTSRNKSFVSPGTVETYRIPTIGLLGLCFNNEDQSHFINQSFSHISIKDESAEYLKLYFLVSYDSPGMQPSTAVKISQTLFLNFIEPES
ncbi:hypothetical protein OLZ31_24690 [Enterobacter asburiae]|nr:hypothetical protein [Enterobacter asburiae]